MDTSARPGQMPSQTRWVRMDQVSSFLQNRYFLYCVSLALFFYSWDAISLSKIFGSYMPRPLDVVFQMTAIIGDTIGEQTLQGHLWASLQRVLLGFGIAIATGIPLGLAMATNRNFCTVVKPVFDLMKPMPPISWISLAILWFGVGEPSKIFIIWIGAVVPLVINAFNGIRLVDPELYDVVRMLGGGKRQETIQVAIPASFPAIFAGLQISLSTAWGCVVAAELIASRSGVGYLINLGMTRSRPSLIIGGMAVIAITAWLLASGMSWVERWVCPWKREIR